MNLITRAVGRLVRDEAGQDLVEYGLLMMLIAVGAMVAVSTLGDTVNTLFWESIAQNI
jgi:Flp pilus assembly pilin Flp